MGERKGTNKYYPPDFDPAKHGSLNKYHGSHPLRERARKLAQGILVIRFEMPFNIWCEGCDNHIGMGVRYNAEKKKVGTYYTTPIYRFRMKCHLCSHTLELQTDPASCDYLIVSGGRRKEERWDPSENGQLQTTAPEQRLRLQQDAMLRLEQGEGDRATLQQAVPSLQRLQLAQEAWKDDFALNCRLRQLFREEKKTLREEEEEEGALGPKAGLGVPLLPEAEADRRLAALLSYCSPLSYEEKQRMKRLEISSRSWFSPVASSSGGTGGTGGVLRKLWGGCKTGAGGGAAQGPPPSPLPTPTGLGIVRRRRRRKRGEEEEEETPPQEGEKGTGGVGRGETSPQEPQRGQEVEGGGDPGPLPQTPSLVADYSDSSSEAEGS